MFGRKDRERPGEISLAGHQFGERAVEVARLWVPDRGPSTCLVRPELLTEPEMFGIVLSDAMSQGATALSRHRDLSEADAFLRIWRGVTFRQTSGATGENAGRKGRCL